MDLDELKAKLENSNEVVYPTTDYDKRERMAEPTDENIGLNIPVVNYRTWTVDEIVEELKDIDAFDAAKYFFDKYGS